MARIPRVLAKRGPYRPRKGFASQRGIRFDEAKHKRGAAGRFVDMPDQLRLDLRKPSARTREPMVTAARSSGSTRLTQRELKRAYNEALAEAGRLGVPTPGMRPWRNVPGSRAQGEARLAALRERLAQHAVPTRPLKTAAQLAKEMEVLRTYRTGTGQRDLSGDELEARWRALPEAERQGWRDAHRRLRAQEAQRSTENEAMRVRLREQQETRDWGARHAVPEDMAAAMSGPQRYAFARLNPRARGYWRQRWQEEGLTIPPDLNEQIAARQFTPEESARLIAGNATPEFRELFGWSTPRQRADLMRAMQPRAAQPTPATPDPYAPYAPGTIGAGAMAAFSANLPPGRTLGDADILAAWNALPAADRQRHLDLAAARQVTAAQQAGTLPPVTERDRGISQLAADDRWNAIVRVPPAQFAREMNEGLPPGVAVRTSVGEYGDGLSMRFSITRNGENIGDATRYITPKRGGGYHVKHSIFSFNEGQSGAGIGKVFLANSMRQYQRMGVADVEVHTGLDVGGYAWAKYGFKLDNPSSGILSTVNGRLDTLESNGQVSAADAAAIRTKLASGRPTILWEVADLKQSVQRSTGNWNPTTDTYDMETTTLGKALLLGTNWNGTLNLSDREAMDRFWAYVTPPKPQPVSPSIDFAGSSRYGGNPDDNRRAWDRIVGIDPDAFVQQVSKDMPGPVLITAQEIGGEMVVSYTFTRPLTPGNEANRLSAASSRPGFDATQYESVGRATREMKRSGDVRTVYHSLMKINKAAQGTGIAKVHMRNLMEQYRAMGVTKVTVSANIDVGGHAWARYGYKLTGGSSQGLKANLHARLDSFASQLSAADLADVRATIDTNSTRKLWKLSDLKQPQVSYGGKTMPLGKALLIDQNWSGTLRLSDADAMARFDAYVNNRPTPAIRALRRATPATPNMTGATVASAMAQARAANAAAAASVAAAAPVIARTEVTFEQARAHPMWPAFVATYRASEPSSVAAAKRASLPVATVAYERWRRLSPDERRRYVPQHRYP